MRVKLIPETHYHVEIDGKLLEGTFERDGTRWNGLECFKGETGKIIFQPDILNPVVLFLTGDGVNPEGELVSASPSILSEIKSTDHNTIAALYREELLKNGIRGENWDDIIYNFASKYNGPYTGVRSCINKDISKILVKEPK